MARFNLIPAHRGTAQNGKETLQNTLNEPKPYQMNAKSFSKKISHRSTTVWTYILEKPSVLCQALGCQCFCDVVEGKQCSVLLQAILTLY